MEFVSGDQPRGGQVATVLELLPGGIVRLELESRREVLAHPASSRVLNTTRLRPGDRVEVALSPHDTTRGRIIRLLPAKC
ncbi:MAG: translation initiation factor IF-1 [Bryobacterales bacterium]|nr:translation initiation factor IF-1 [Bryobacterales bacterium]